MTGHDLKTEWKAFKTLTFLCLFLLGGWRRVCERDGGGGGGGGARGVEEEQEGFVKEEDQEVCEWREEILSFCMGGCVVRTCKRNDDMRCERGLGLFLGNFFNCCP